MTKEVRSLKLESSRSYFSNAEGAEVCREAQRMKQREPSKGRILRRDFGEVSWKIGGPMMKRIILLCTVAVGLGSLMVRADDQKKDEAKAEKKAEAKDEK